MSKPDKPNETCEYVITFECGTKPHTFPGVISKACSRNTIEKDASKKFTTLKQYVARAEGKSMGELRSCSILAAYGRTLVDGKRQGWEKYKGGATAEPPKPTSSKVWEKLWKEKG